MRLRDKAGGRAAKAQRPKTLKRRNGLKTKETNIAQFIRERDEAREQQTATAEILRVIRTTPTDTQPVFEAIVQSGLKLFPDAAILIVLPDGDKLRAAAFADTDPARAKALLRVWPVPLTREYNHAIAILDRRMIDIPEARDAPSELAAGAQYFLTTGYRAITIMPMMRGGDAIGALSVVRAAPGALSDKQIAVLRTFADQAVIAIENTRLLNELRQRTDDLTEALEQQTATSDVLRVISSSPTNVQPVFDAIAESSVRLCDGQFSFVVRFDGKVMDFASCCGLSAEGLDAFHSILPMPASEHTAAGRAIVRRAVVEISDVETDLSYGAQAKGLAKAVIYRSIAAVPLLHEGNPIGAIAVARANAGSFPKRQIVLLQAFADQAVIAIENTRLFEEVQARTWDLQESLQQQTATADVLKVISRSLVDLETVLETLVETVARLCRADQVYMFHLRHDLWHLVAAWGLSAEAREFFLTHPFTPGRGSTSGRAALERRAVLIPDVLQDPEYALSEGQKIAGYRTTLGIPLLREDTLIGVFSITRTRVEAFTEKEIELATTFADQAVIAIENARLFEELHDRQAELRVTFDNMGDGVVMFDAEARLAAWNRNFQEMLDLPDAFLAGRPNYAGYFRYLADRGEYSADLEAQLSRTIDDTRREMRFERTRPDGRVIEVRRNSVPGGGFVLIYADVTERKRAEEAIRAARDAAETALRELQMAQASLVHAQKMAALGQVTAGIAHEIKNPLNFVNNFSTVSGELIDELQDSRSRTGGQRKDAQADRRADGYAARQSRQGRAAR